LDSATINTCHVSIRINDYFKLHEHECSNLFVC
jgi:hypothetical protein